MVSSGRFQGVWYDGIIYLDGDSGRQLEINRRR